ncbi:MAG: T9SS type A sorting domain-containing protein [Ignavibacteriaceae bacterium]|nr:T9SS type A sorting domain-containing protein [Ignavibacteriaceae bacterium]
MIIVAVELPTFTPPADYVLAQNYPNPFNPTTTIEYSIPERTEVKLTVVNLVGEEVAVLVNQTMDAGNYKVEFSAKGGLPSGVYFYSLQVYPANGGAGNFITTKKMILLK